LSWNVDENKPLASGIRSSTAALVAGHNMLLAHAAVGFRV
jgi:homoserine kinase